jgi:hypothetical protein
MSTAGSLLKILSLGLRKESEFKNEFSKKVSMTRSKPVNAFSKTVGRYKATAFITYLLLI